MALKRGARINAGDKLLTNGSKALKVLQSRYTEFHYLISAVLREEDMKLVKGSWLLHYQTSGHSRFPRCQDIPPEGFWTAEEFESFQRLILTVAISYCWLHPVHPDPQGLHFQTLCRALRLRLEVTGPAKVEDIALFLDYCSLPQKGEVGDRNSPSPGEDRTPEEAQSFKKGLQQVNIVYAHQVIDTWMLQWTPKEIPNYMQRGWPFFERCVSSLIKDAAKLYDIKHMFDYQSWQQVHDFSTEDRLPPITPAAFDKLLEEKHFTNGKTDFQFVKGKYAETFKDVVGGATELLFSGLGWGDLEAEQLTHLLPFALCLETLCLGANHITTTGALLLAKAAKQCPTLRSIDFSGNGIDDLLTVCQAWQESGKDPKELRIGGTSKPRPGAKAEWQRPEDAERLAIGMKVRVCGLQARPELNGLEGVLTFFDDQRARWQVELTNGKGAKLFKAANLEQNITDEDALDILKGKAKAPMAAKPKPAPAAAGPDAGQAQAPKPVAKAAAAAPDEDEDDEAFVLAIERCLKECDVMWDDY